MSKIMGREIDIAYDRDQRMGFFRDNELSFTVDGSGITDEELAQILGGTILVRCQDCESWETSWKPQNAIEGEYWCSMCDIYSEADDFCSRGRRRTE